MNDKYKIGIIGLGYVGLPLACIFARKYPVVGFDTNCGRVEEIARGEDRNGDILHEKLAGAVAGGLRCTADLAVLGPALTTLRNSVSRTTASDRSTWIGCVAPADSFLTSGELPPQNEMQIPNNKHFIKPFNFNHCVL